MIAQKIELTEWETLKLFKSGPVLVGHPTAQSLAERLTSARQVEILELAKGLEIRTNSFVGRFALGELLITIRPKISGLPLMNLLRYAYRLRNLKLFDDVRYSVMQLSFEDLLIHQLASEASELLARGLHRDYLRTNSVLAIPRGRIDLGSYVQVAANAGVALPCTHFPRSEDTCLNQVLHGGLELAARTTLDRELAGNVRRLAKRFTERISPRNLDVRRFAEAWQSLDRRTSAYRPALTLIQMLMQSQGAALTDTSSLTPAAGFLFDMNRFFQALLSRFLGENLVGYKVLDEQALRGVFCYDTANNPRNRDSPKLRPDFLVLRDDKIEAVLDAKYRDLWETKLPREMLYQLAAYALGHQSGNRQATIIYPTLTEVARQQIILINDPHRGSLIAKIVLRPLHLLKLERLLNDEGVGAQRNRIEFATHLAFGTPTNVST